MTLGSIFLSIGQSGLALGSARLAQQQNAAFLPPDYTGAPAAAWEWLVLLALAFWVGMPVFEGVARASSLLARVQKQTRLLQWLCLAVLFVGNIVVLILRGSQLTAALDLIALGRILFTSTYGALWLARLGLILLAAGMPMFTRRRRRAAAIARLVLAGLILLTLIYAGTVVAPNPVSLPGTKNPAAPVVTPSPAGDNFTQSKRAGNLSITLEVTPARVELANTILVTITNTRSGQPVENAQIAATTNMQAMDMGTTRVTMSGGKPVYRAMFPADSAFSMFGLWNIMLLIRQPGHTSVQIVFTILLND